VQTLYERRKTEFGGTRRDTALGGGDGHGVEHDLAGLESRAQHTLEVDARGHGDMQLGAEIAGDGRRNTTGVLDGADEADGHGAGLRRGRAPGQRRSG
jgi:hypothetical protein